MNGYFATSMAMLAAGACWYCYRWGCKDGHSEGHAKGFDEGYLEGHVAGAAQANVTTQGGGGGPKEPA